MGTAFFYGQAQSLACRRCWRGACDVSGSWSIHRIGPGAPWKPEPNVLVSDFNSDQFVSQADLDAVLLNLGNTSSATAIAAVPEPTTAGLLGVAGASLLARRRRD